jgi:hypothetical protein
LYHKFSQARLPYFLWPMLVPPFRHPFPFRLIGLLFPILASFGQVRPGIGIAISSAA